MPQVRRIQFPAAQLLAGFLLWQREHGSALDDRGVAYTMLHGLSHALMAEIALECGYPASALKERIYALWDPVRLDATGRFGILIYTATAGNQLFRQAPLQSKRNRATGSPCHRTSVSFVLGTKVTESARLVNSPRHFRSLQLRGELDFGSQSSFLCQCNEASGERQILHRQALRFEQGNLLGIGAAGGFAGDDVAQLDELAHVQSAFFHGWQQIAGLAQSRRHRIDCNQAHAPQRVLVDFLARQRI